MKLDIAEARLRRDHALPSDFHFYKWECFPPCGETLYVEWRSPMANYKSYNAYLSSDTFRIVRSVAMNKADWKCRRCGARATEVNHLRYPPWGTWDMPSNLEPICHACHCEEHDKPC